MDKKVTKHILGGLLILAIFLIGFFVGRLVFPKKSSIISQSGSLKNEREGSFVDQWNFINPLLDCGELDNISNKTINKAKEKVSDYIDEQKIKGVEEVSIYFRDLNNGPWFGINETAEFTPGSLLKVPRMISVLKVAEKDPSILEKQIFIKDIINSSIQYFKPEVSLVAGKTYTIAELISLMILYSDNGATSAFEQFMTNEELFKSYQELGIKTPEQGNDYRISIRTYSSFFRILFNASFITRDYSEQALKLLSRTVFDKGLRAGVPPHIPVAHKFGERTSSGIKQLHDCGIVYYPDKPYLLCVMTRGNDLDQLASFIAQVSKIVYDVVDQEK